MVHKKVLNLTVVSLFIALTVTLSPFYIPLGTAKIFPVQHAVNILLGVLLGPLYAVSAAFITSTIRIMLGTGSLLAYPGSMIGALLCSILYRYSHRLMLAYVGEVIGTGILGALLSFPIATFVLGKEVALFGFIIPFSLSSIGGTLCSIIIITTLQKTGVLDSIQKSLANQTKVL